MLNQNKLRTVVGVSEMLLTLKFPITSESHYLGMDAFQGNLAELQSLVNSNSGSASFPIKLKKMLPKLMVDMLYLYKCEGGNNAGYLELYETITQLDILSKVVDGSLKGGEMPIDERDKLDVGSMDYLTMNMLSTLLGQFSATSNLVDKISAMDRVLSVYLCFLGRTLDVEDFMEYATETYI